MDSDLCPQGKHPQTPENTLVRSDGSLRCRACKAEKDRNYRQSEAGKVKIAARQRARRARVKTRVIGAYGGKCACCGEIERAFLVLDHVNGGGNIERKALGGNRPLYDKLIRENFPSGYQVLCCNCNHARHFEGECPHQTRT